MIDLSIIILNYNNRKLLVDCIDSIYRNTKKLKLELILVDNHSSDDSVAMIRKKFPKVHIIVNEDNLGFTKANNRGLRIARGRYVMLLNNDTIVNEFALKTMVEFMDLNPKAGACGPKLLNLDGTPQRQGSILGKRFWRSNQPVEVAFVIGAALMVRRAILKRVGLMDEKLYFYNDDLDWCKRIRNRGYKVYFIPQAEVIHYGGYSTHRTFNQKTFMEGFKGGLHYVKKHYGPFVFQVYRILLGIAMLISLPFVCLNPKKRNAYLEISRIALTNKA